jgi:hypothetical protein
MRNFNLNIAGYCIRFECISDGLELVLSERFLKYISRDIDHDVFIKVHSGNIEIPKGTEKVFSAPYIEEINGIRIKKNDEFWSIFKHDKVLFIQADFPFLCKSRSAILKFSTETKEWDLFVTSSLRSIDPMEYPLDGLILYYLTVISGDTMIHGSGVNYKGNGYLFSGISGKGKTTMAKLWDNHGAEIIHDDRLIIRKTTTGYSMYNTPVYRNDEPRKSDISTIFLIGHGAENEIIPVRGASAISMVMANCIQHNWDPGIIKGLIETISQICATIPVYRLLFKPDSSIIEYLLKNE